MPVLYFGPQITIYILFILKSSLVLCNSEGFLSWEIDRFFTGFNEFININKIKYMQYCCLAHRGYAILQQFGGSEWGMSILRRNI
jgi:hypothetical protein